VTARRPLAVRTTIPARTSWAALQTVDELIEDASITPVQGPRQHPPLALSR